MLKDDTDNCVSSWEIISRGPGSVRHLLPTPRSSLRFVAQNGSRERENEIMRDTHAEEVRQKNRVWWPSSLHRLPVDGLFCSWTLSSIGFGWMVAAGGTDTLPQSAVVLEISQMRGCQTAQQQRRAVKDLRVRGGPHAPTQCQLICA